MTTIQRLRTIDWVDLSVPDAEAACAFYGRVLGWTFERSESPLGTYHLAMRGGHQAAGIMASSVPGVPPSWSVFVRVASVGETLATVTNSAGTVAVPPFEIPGGAEVAVVADPTGAHFAVIAGGPDPEPGEPVLIRDEPGAVAWCELLTRDPHAAIGFYDAVFGWVATMDPATGYTMLRLGDTTVGGLLPMPAEMPPQVPSYWAVYFGTSDLPASVAAAVSAGATVQKPPTSIGDISFAVLSDPAGASFGLMSMQRSSSDATAS